MTTINDLDKAEQDKVEDVIWANSGIINEQIKAVMPLSKFGICHRCTNFEFAESEFNVEHSKCADFNKALSERRPIKNCTNFNEKGIMSLNDMKGIAWILDFNERKVGF